ncbi:DUF551 domain-containing protein [Citrobacter freundii]|uniref:DUF551 domain-containing protein n=1 Tax=Citrobacter freundii TaxID=546 RepID=UPI001FFDF692|nr:DUF551 domain-containing protein [Citrobacter freundii]
MTTNNHPAHGPVSLDRLHQIREILSKAAAQSDGGNLGYAMADAVKVIDGAIAAFGAEPVAWLLSGGGAKNNVSFDSGNAYADPLREVTPLYTAPPAPVSVPAAMEMDDDFDSAFEHGKAVGWNAYRAAMLNRPSSSQASMDADVGGVIKQPSSNSGWIPVSERVPEESGRYWCYVEEQNSLGKSHYQWNCSWNGEAWSDKALSGRVTHWMPLPAAPQQEAK